MGNLQINTNSMETAKYAGSPTHALWFIDNYRKYVTSTFPDFLVVC